MFKVEDYNNKKIAIHVKTQEEHDKLLNLIDTTKQNYWYVNEETTCITISNLDWQYCNIKYYKNKKYKIVEFSDIMQFTKSDLQDTDIVTRKNGSKFLWREMFKEDFKEDLTNIANNIGNEYHDIIKVERPTNLVIVYEREEKVKVSLDELVKCYEQVHKVKAEVE